MPSLRYFQNIITQCWAAERFKSTNQSYYLGYHKKSANIGIAATSTFLPEWQQTQHRQQIQRLPPTWISNMKSREMWNLTTVSDNGADLCKQPRRSTLDYFMLGATLRGILSENFCRICKCRIFSSHKKQKLILEHLQSQRRRDTFTIKGVF